ncbi:MAG: hypothetical protein ABSE73_19275 [Planctomycetota bacterium]
MLTRAARIASYSRRVALCLLLCALAAEAAESGALKGCVKYKGDPPPPQVTKLEGHHRTDCQCEEIVSEALVVDKATRGIRWAIVRIMDAGPAGTDSQSRPRSGLVSVPAVMDQIKCTFVPHVIIVTPGTELTVLNSDKIPHNVHTVPLDGLNTPVNRMMAATDEKLVLKGRCLSEPELIQVQCDIHTWMRAYLVVHDPRRAALSNSDGTFEIKDLPAGKHKVSVFQETLGEQNLEVEIKAVQTTDVGEIVFKAK